MAKNSWKNGIFKKILAMVIISELAGVLGSIFTISSIPTWYATLAKPEFTPPNWLFGPVWITLYLLMGISAGLIWHSNSKEKKKALGIFGAQLMLNTLWSILFFGIHLTGIAFFEIVILWITIGGTIFTFSRIDKKAAALLIPYIAWVTIASMLNYYVWMLNAA